jgi:hypothetical protein
LLLKVEAQTAARRAVRLREERLNAVDAGAETSCTATAAGPCC